MKKILLILVYLFTLSSMGQAVVTNPDPMEVDQSVTITVDTNSSDTDCNGFSSPTKVYLHSGVGADADPWEHTIGNWGLDDGVGEMTDIGGGLWSITFVPETYYGLSSTEASEITKMGMVFRSEDGSEELKDNGCTDFFFNVGAFQVQMINPNAVDFILVASGGGTQIIAQNTNGPADYELFANGSSVHTQNGTTFYNGYNFTNLTENQYCDLVVTQGSSSITKSFVILVNNTSSQSLPSGLEDGINYNASDSTKATLVLDAPLKDFVYVSGSFNNWEPTASYAMKKDATTGKYWLELTGLTAGTIYTYQYWVAEETALDDSPELVKTADPFSTLVLSPFDDPWIPAVSYPNMPVYPDGQEREVTVLQTGQSAYNWQVANFVKPKKEDLVIYEVLIRDFDANRNFQDLIDRIDYFKNLNINAIELLPIMEFEGNESWGYNPAFHMALDKYYGTADKFKELVDVCHQNDIAVILDIALNHAFGRNPMNRMWMVDDDGDGWGEPSSENPYFNEEATHSYSVGSDFNHQQPLTKAYTKRVIKHWIEEFHIDGFRWDLTKGFTQECEGDEGCTNSYQPDRVAILKEYADYSWSVDPTHYVIFEHLGADNEEQQWANYRIGEGKGIMMWGKMGDPYNELTMGQNGNKNFDRMGYESHGFTDKRLVGYAESHDEERLMYKNLQYGNTSNSGHNVTELAVALSRMSALGAVTIPIPGPKMIWHFGELGMENSIFTCTDGSYNDESSTIPYDCKLATKPQPQWVNDWLADTDRAQIYNDWAKINALKQQEDVFEGDYTIESGSLTPRIYIYDTTLPSSDLKNVVILANFDVTAQGIIPDFPNTGTWYNLMDDTSFNVTNTASPINLEPGEFKIFGNQEVVLAVDTEALQNIITIYPNPASEIFILNTKASKVSVFDLTGKLVKSFNTNANNSYNVSDLSPALYFVRIETNKGISTQRLVIE